MKPIVLAAALCLLLLLGNAAPSSPSTDPGVPSPQAAEGAPAVHLKAVSLYALAGR